MIFLSTSKNACRNSQLYGCQIFTVNIFGCGKLFTYPYRMEIKTTQTAQPGEDSLTTQQPDISAEPRSSKPDLLTLLERLCSFKYISRAEASPYESMTLQEIENAIFSSFRDKSTAESSARHLFMAFAQALSCSRWRDDKSSLGSVPFISELTPYLAATPSLTADAYRQHKMEKIWEKHHCVRSWGYPRTTEGEFSISIGDTTQVILFQFYKGELIVSDGLCYDQSKPIKALAEAIRKITGKCDSELQDSILLTAYLRQTGALNSFENDLINSDDEAWNRASDCQESDRYTVNSHFAFVSADVDAFGDCEVVGRIAIGDMERLVIFRNAGDEMHIARIGEEQEANVSALAQVLRDKTAGVGDDVDVLMDFLEEQAVMDRVRYIAHTRYRAFFEGPDEILESEDTEKDWKTLPMYRMVKLGSAYQIQKASLRGYKTEWHPALNVSEEFVAKVKAEEEAFCFDRDCNLLSRAVRTANRPKNTLPCPRCGAELVFRTASVLTMGSKPFWGCSNFPTCRHTHLIETHQ